MRQVDFSEWDKEDLDFYGIEGHRQYWKTRSEFSYGKTPRPNNGITLILCESAVYTLPNGVQLKASAGDVVLIPCGAQYTVQFKPRPRPEVDTLLLNFRVRDEAGGEVVSRQGPQLLCRDREGVLFGQMTAAVDAAATGRYLRAKRCLLQVVETLFLWLGEERQDPFFAIPDYINEHLGQALSVPELARRFAVSDATLRRWFAAKTGLSPVAYIRRQKIERAKRMLTFAECSVEDICEQLGFYDASYFHKLFKAETGMSPTAYRKSGTGGACMGELLQKFPHAPSKTLK